MIAFQPDGPLQTKVNLCSSKNCIIGDFVKCPFKSGSKISFGDVDSEAEYSDEEDEAEYECDDLETEKNELQSESVFDVIEIGSFVTLFSSTTSFELLYLCKVIDFGIAEENMQDSYNHLIMKEQDT